MRFKFLFLKFKFGNWSFGHRFYSRGVDCGVSCGAGVIRDRHVTQQFRTTWPRQPIMVAAGADMAQLGWAKLPNLSVSQMHLSGQVWSGLVWSGQLWGHRFALASQCARRLFSENFHSFSPSFIRPSIHSFIDSFIHTFNKIIHSSIHSFISILSFKYSFINSFIHFYAFILIFIH